MSISVRSRVKFVGGGRFVGDQVLGDGVTLKVGNVGVVHSIPGTKGDLGCTFGTIKVSLNYNDVEIVAGLPSLDDLLSAPTSSQATQDKSKQNASSPAARKSRQFANRSRSVSPPGRTKREAAVDTAGGQSEDQSAKNRTASHPVMGSSSKSSHLSSKAKLPPKMTDKKVDSDIASEPSASDQLLSADLTHGAKSMASRFIQDFEKLYVMNKHRAERVNSYVNKAQENFTKICTNTFKKMRDGLSNEDARLRTYLEEIVDRAITSLSSTSRTIPTRMLDDIMDRMLADIKPLKEKLLTCNAIAWSENFGLADGSEQSEDSGPGMALVEIRTMSGLSRKIICSSNGMISELKKQIHGYGGPRPSDQRLVSEDGSMLDSDNATLDQLGIENGSTITLVSAPPYCECCRGTCKCVDCHGEGRYGKGCKVCGKVRPDCPVCGGACKCSSCHGDGGYINHIDGRYCNYCGVCGRRPPCWGGDTLAILADGCVKKIRDCRVGDQVRTLRGSRRIVRIWERDPAWSQNVDTEICCIEGVWITSHHPIIHEGEWIFPADVRATAPWSKRLHIVPDMYNFELDGHDDTILLWGGFAGDVPVISCTIGKFLGPRFGNGIHTRRTTRCFDACLQCDAVFMADLKHNRIPADLRWGRFPDFPQVEWDDGVSEFELAAEVIQDFVPPVLRFATVVSEPLFCQLCSACDRVSKPAMFTSVGVA